MKLRAPVKDVLDCEQPKRVFPYHIWLPYGKYSRYYKVSKISLTESDFDQIYDFSIFGQFICERDIVSNSLHFLLIKSR